ncbi:MAG: 4a-hydroxytetrahydrobiopterin dehydratase [Actinomycetota bacterium]|nr:4a-hydroxytetrahydrobiopterin dehydratase [Actinomycetota bacterium]
MTDEPQNSAPALTRTAASTAVEAIGWRYLLATLATSVPAATLSDALRLASVAAVSCGDRADGHLRIDVRPDRVELSLQTRASGFVTDADVELARSVSAALEAVGADTGGATVAELPRPVQMLEMAIDAMDIPAIRPFWRAVLAYTDEPGSTGPDDAIIDPTGQLPAIWFQQLDEPRTQRNRVHFDITVAHDEAQLRVDAALAAGGVLVSDAAARSFWVLADTEGNEVCVCTWTDRDEREAATQA